MPELQVLCYYVRIGQLGIVTPFSHFKGFAWCEKVQTSSYCKFPMSCVEVIIKEAINPQKFRYVGMFRYIKQPLQV